MLAGIFWLDESPGSGLEAAVLRAAASYRLRFHRDPTLCLVPPGAIHGHAARLGQVAVRVHASLPPHHLWIGVEDARRPGQPPRGPTRATSAAHAFSRRPR